MYQINEIINTIICGNALTELKKIPDESINTIVTSPPYWGLRDYGIEPVIWDEKECEHEFSISSQSPIKHIFLKMGLYSIQNVLMISYLI